MAGYSGMPLTKKLGLKAGMTALVVQPPDHYETLLDPMPEGVMWCDGQGADLDWIHVFVTEAAALELGFPAWKAALVDHGCLWISWPKGSSGVITDLKGGIVRQIGLAHGLVDIKVCALDATWSGLKFVYRLADRKK